MVKRTLTSALSAVLIALAINVLPCYINLPLLPESCILRLLLTIALIKLTKRFHYNFIPDHWRADSDGAYVVVGASKGIGRCAAQELLRRGGRVVLAARSTQQCQEAVNEVPNAVDKATVLKVDLASKQSMDEFIAELKKLNLKIRVLILNSGLTMPKLELVDGIEKTFKVNHLGFMYLTYHLHKQLAENAPSRLVIVASDVHRFATKLRTEPGSYNFPDGFTHMAAYSHSKLCNVLFARALAKITDPKVTTVICVHPGGPVESHLTDGLPIVGGDFLGVKRAFYWAIGRTSAEGAHNLLNAALRPDVGDYHGQYLENLEVDTAYNFFVDLSADNERRLWKVSCDLLGLPNEWN